MKHVKPDQHYPLTAIEAGMFLIFDIERSFDEHVCHSEDDVRQFIKDVDAQNFRVVQFFLDEGNCRDVTADFVPDEDDEPSAIDIPSPDELYRQHMARVL